MKSEFKEAIILDRVIFLLCLLHGSFAVKRKFSLPVLHIADMNIVGCRAVTMQRPRGKQIYQSHFSQRISKHIPAATDNESDSDEQQRNGVFCGPRSS
jgi:hypothetical protein